MKISMTRWRRRKFMLTPTPYFPQDKRFHPWVSRHHRHWEVLCNWARAVEPKQFWMIEAGAKTFLIPGIGASFSISLLFNWIQSAMFQQIQCIRTLYVIHVQCTAYNATSQKNLDVWIWSLTFGFPLHIHRCGNYSWKLRFFRKWLSRSKSSFCR